MNHLCVLKTKKAPRQKRPEPVTYKCYYLPIMFILKY